jgi:hypothetical protein
VVEKTVRIQTHVRIKQPSIEDLGALPYTDWIPSIKNSKKSSRFQRLPNGNTLITESDNGRVFEVTRDGEVVWEFFMPTVSQKGGVLRSTIYRMTRIIDVERFF